MALIEAGRWSTAKLFKDGKEVSSEEWNAIIERDGHISGALEQWLVCPICGAVLTPRDDHHEHMARHGYYWTREAGYGYAKAEIDPADGKLKFVNQ